MASNSAFASTSKYLERKIIELLHSNTAWTAPTTLYLGLFQSFTAPSTFHDQNLDNNTPTGELSGSGYARAAIGSWTLNTVDGFVDSVSNSSVITFPTSTAAWAPFRFFAIMDAATGGNVLWWGEVDFVSVPLGSQLVFRIPVGSLKISFPVAKVYKQPVNLSLDIAEWPFYGLGVSNYVADKLLKWLFAGQAWSAPSTLFLGLFPNDTAVQLSKNSTVSEISGNGYARVRLAKSAPIYTIGSPSIRQRFEVLYDTAQGTSFSFPEATADWGWVYYAAIMDAATGGNVIFYSELTEPRYIREREFPLRLPNLMTVGFA